MELYDHIRKISFGFFVGLGLTHFLAGFFYINDYFPKEAGLVNRILFIPFVLATLTFALSNLRYRLLEYGKTSKTWEYAFLGFGVAVFLGLLVIELLVADSPHPLKP